MSDSSGSNDIRPKGDKRSRANIGPRDRLVSDSEFASSSKRLHIDGPLLSTQDMDQPADLSMKKERRDTGDPGLGSSRSLMQSIRPRHSRDWWAPGREIGEAESSSEGVVLDLASKGPNRSTSKNEGKEENSDNDVIVLSDEDGPRLNGHINGFSCNDEAVSDDGTDKMPEIQELKELSDEELKRRELLINKLKENLRSEEMKLVLLKKLQLSHQLKENLVVSSQPSKVSSNSMNSRGAVNSPVSVPPPLVRGNQSGLPKPPIQSSSQQMMVPPLVRPLSAHGPPPLVMTPRMSSSSSSVSSNVMMQERMLRAPNIVGRIPVTTPPSVIGYPLPSQSQVQPSPVSTTSSPSLSHSQQSQGERADSQTPAQRQAAAKLALRKQLEKTLLQIPPPKPPPPEMHFVPNPANTEFIYLVGLEAIVNFITEGDAQKDDDVPKPFNCVQCSTDFTPVWKWENTKKGTVICEQCVTSNIKKALKAEHTNRLKTAFVKALQQEQEIEQRMSQVSSSPPMSIPTHTSSPVTTSPSLLQLPKLVEPMRPSHVASVASANLNAAHQQLLRLPQHQPLPAHMLAPLNPFLAQAYHQYQVLGKNPVTSAELQRQYLLDMIPSRSLPQGTINWKT